MKFFKPLFFIFLFCSALYSKAQTADEIIAKHIQAIGGKDVIGNIKTVVSDVSINAMGSDSPGKVTIVNDKGFRYEADINGQKLIQVFTDTAGWMINPWGANYAQKMPAEQYNSGKDQIEIGGQLMDYAAKGSKVELLGQEQVGDVSAHKIKLTDKNNIETLYFIDPANYYIVKTSRVSTDMNGQKMNTVATYSDYKKTDSGLVFPFTIGIDFGGQFSIVEKVTKIEFNTPVEPTVFNMPK